MFQFLQKYPIVFFLHYPFIIDSVNYLQNDFFINKKYVLDTDSEYWWLVFLVYI